MTAEEQAVGHLDRTWLRQLPVGADDRGGHGFAQDDDADVPIGEAGKPASAVDAEARDTRGPSPRELPPPTASCTPTHSERRAAWLETAAAEPRWESESIVKLLFATNGSPEQLLEHLRHFRDHATARWNAAAAIFRPYLHGDEPFPDRTHVNVLAARLVLETARAEAAWADRAIEEVQHWETTAEPQDRASTLAALEAALAAGAP